MISRAEIEPRLVEIEDAFRRRLPATLSILLEALAVRLEKTGDPRSALLRSASGSAYRGCVDESRVLFDAAIDAMPADDRGGA